MYELLDTIQEMANFGIWEVDLSTNRTLWSKEVYRIHELPLGTEVDVSKGLDFYHPDYKDIISQAVEAAVSQGKSFDLELKLITFEGKERWVRSVGKPTLKNGIVVALSGFFQDIHLRKEADLENQRARKAYDFALNAGNIGTWQWNLHDGSLIWNESMHRIFDWPADVFKGKFEDFADRLHPDDIPLAAKALKTALEGGDKYNIEYRIITRDGKIRYIAAKADVEHDKQDKAIHITGVCMDITTAKENYFSIKKAEEEIKALNDSLERKVEERTAKLQAVNKELEAFCYSVSHDLRSPLRGISGYTQALKEDYYDLLDEQGKYYIRRTLKGTLRMSQLIEDLLNLSRISRKEINKKATDLSQMVKVVAEEIGERYTGEGAKSTFDFHVTSGLLADCDKQLMMILFENLVDNAYKFSANSPQPRIEFGTFLKGDVQVYFLKDNGVGFDMAFAEKLFGAFQRLHSTKEFKGTGIGLATVKRIVSLHGGNIWAESQPGEGTTFFFTLETSNLP